MGEHASQTFFKILKSIPKSQNHQNWLSVTKILKKILNITNFVGSRLLEHPKLDNVELTPMPLPEKKQISSDENNFGQIAAKKEF